MAQICNVDITTGYHFLNCYWKSYPKKKFIFHWYYGIVGFIRRVCFKNMIANSS